MRLPPILLAAASCTPEGLSRDDAVVLAKQEVGSAAVDAIPFQNTGENREFIVVLVRNPPDSISDFRLVLLHGTEPAYQATDPGMESGDNVELPDDTLAYMRSVYGVVDVDRDGNQEIDEEASVWTSYFKGPLIGYDKESRTLHVVAQGADQQMASRALPYDLEPKDGMLYVDGEPAPVPGGVDARAEFAAARVCTTPS